ncbi:hypothetical protein [Sulfurisphaera tokodaii]|uniref:Uncharacterized protein n=2 Tax=Sulfurisphaera tokodaii TaxID=111955 RepID=Q96Z97_SULTO|nr:hypothetical protein [Sulfurisphaera tokodaii]BAB67029.1 hypothetical protein STK_19350 [Sulfurisphaera tokodaii str. 7]HII74196.1 hypothetical protein [Sulfurisphaera tokodaii]
MTEFQYASVSLITDSRKDVILKILSNERTNLSLPSVSLNEAPYLKFSIPSPPFTTISYDELSLLMYEVSFNDKKKITLQSALGKTTIEKVADTVSKLSELGRLLTTNYLIEVMLSYVLDAELRGVSKYKKAGYVLVDYSGEGNLRESEYLLSIAISPYIYDPKKSAVEIIYRDKQVNIETIKNLLDKVEKIVKGEEKLA